jgi:hypothetical protein
MTPAQKKKLYKRTDAQWARKRRRLLERVGIDHEESIESELRWRNEVLRYSNWLKSLPETSEAITTRMKLAADQHDFYLRVRAAWENEHLRFVLTIANGDAGSRTLIRFRDEDEIWYLLKYA